MKIQISAFAVATALAALSTPALAAGPVIVKLTAPLAAPTKVVAGGAIFSCAGDACVAASPANGTADFSTCKIVARSVGAVTSFGTAAAPLAADRLAACNESAKK
jgi:hypothetical protein